MELDESHVDPQRVLPLLRAERRKRDFFRPRFSSASVRMKDVQREVVEAAGDAEAADVNGVDEGVGARRPAPDKQDKEMKPQDDFKTMSIKMSHEQHFGIIIGGEVMSWLAADFYCPTVTLGAQDQTNHGFKLN